MSEQQMIEEALFGFAEVTLDKVGRFLIPVEFFERMKGRQPMRMTVDPWGHYLELRTEERFRALVSRIMSAAAGLPPDSAQAAMIEYLGYSVQVQVDSSYRLTIPKKFRDEIVGDESEIVLLGTGEALQVWSRSTFKATQKERRKVLVRDYSSLVRAVYAIPQPPAAPVVDREPDA